MIEALRRIRDMGGRSVITVKGEEFRDGRWCAGIAEEALGKNPQPVCRWTQDEDATWFSGCGEAHVFTIGTPRENSFEFCPYCGNKLEQVDEVMGVSEPA